MSDSSLEQGGGLWSEAVKYDSIRSSLSHTSLRCACWWCELRQSHAKYPPLSSLVVSCSVRMCDVRLQDLGALLDVVSKVCRGAAVVDVESREFVIAPRRNFHAGERGFSSSFMSRQRTWLAEACTRQAVLLITLLPEGNCIPPLKVRGPGGRRSTQE